MKKGKKTKESDFEILKVQKHFHSLKTVPL